MCHNIFIDVFTDNTQDRERIVGRLLMLEKFPLSSKFHEDKVIVCIPMTRIEFFVTV